MVLGLFAIKSYEDLLPGFWLIGCFGFNGPMRQYFSLFRARGRKKGNIR